MSQSTKLVKVWWEIFLRLNETVMSLETWLAYVTVLYSRGPPSSLCQVSGARWNGARWGYWLYFHLNESHFNWLNEAENTDAIYILNIPKMLFNLFFYAIRSSLYLFLLILDNIISSDRRSVSSEVSQYGTEILNIFSHDFHCPLIRSTKRPKMIFPKGKCYVSWASRFKINFEIFSNSYLL